MAGNAEIAMTLQELGKEIAELDNARESLQRERKIYRRLGFSIERLNLRLRKVEARRAECKDLMRRCKGAQRDNTSGLPGIAASYKSSPTT
ncbi:MAG: hypothetical protein M0Z94_04785 [Dehalococcoidales bacterium]|nr:hypothetical protein [Dehalococcoidales bacterium]